MLLLAFALHLLGAPSASEPPRAQLSVLREAGTEGCADGESLAQRVRELSGAPVVTTTVAAPVRVHLVVARESGHYRATLTVSGAQNGVRRLDDSGADCRGLDEAIAVTLALLLDPQARVESQTSSPPPVPRAQATAPTQKVSVSEPSDAVGLRAELSAGVAVGLLDKPVALGGVGVGLGNERFELTLGGKVLQADRVSYGQGYSDLQLYFAYLRACATVVGKRETLALDLCGGPFVGQLSGEGSGYDRNLDEQLSWLAGALGVRLHGALGQPLAWQLSMQAVAPLTRRSLSVVQGAERHQVFHTRNVGALVELGVAVAP
jgi:hypothetical protein